MHVKTFSVKNWQIALLIICLLQTGRLFGQAAIEVEKMNLVILGIENPFTLVVNDVPDSCLSLHTSNGSVVKYGAGQYALRVGTDTTVVGLTVLDSCHNEVVAQRIFRVRPVSVRAYLGFNHRSKAILSGEFKAQGGLMVRAAENDICATFSLVGFTAQFFSQRTGEIWTAYNTGGRFEDAILEKIRTVEPGDWVFFRHISYRYPDMKRTIFSLEELVFRIK